MGHSRTIIRIYTWHATSISHLLHEPPRGALLKHASHRQARPLRPATWRLLTAAERAGAKREPVGLLLLRLLLSRLLLCWLTIAPRSLINMVIAASPTCFR